jgi:hypothetical protein
MEIQDSNVKNISINLPKILEPVCRKWLGREDSNQVNKG